MAFAGDRIKIYSVTTGTGVDVAVGGAAVSTLFATVAEAGLVNGLDYHYVIEQGTEWEHSAGVYSSATGTIGRAVVASKVGGIFGTNKIQLNGTQIIYFPHFKSLMDGLAPTPLTMPVGSVLRVLQTANAGYVSTQSPISFDDTVPSTAEGAQVLSLAITPAAAANKVLARVSMWGASSGDGQVVMAALFRGNTCIQATADECYGDDQLVNLNMEYLDSPNTVAAATYSVRFGPDSSANTARINGQSGGSHRFGGAGSATLTLMEIKG